MNLKILINSLALFSALKMVFFYFIKRIFNRYSKIYFSQTGEDIIISNILNITKGFYIDVGCNEPIKNSNTYLLYCKGWRGINIDANIDLIKKNIKVKKKDISVNTAISDTEKEVIYYKSNQNAVNTIDSSIINEWKEKWRFDSSEKLNTRTLNSVLERLFPNDVKIDLLSIDVEGHDFKVLQSIDLKKYRPRLIVIEMHNFDLNEPEINYIYKYLKINSYKLVAYAIMNGYFLDINELLEKN